MERLDKFLLEKGEFSSREGAKEAILNGDVLVFGKVQKPSFLVDEKSDIQVKKTRQYVSRGAHKLEKAISVFNLDLKSRNVLDIGSSTGGFTQICLLNGAEGVISCDVGSDVMDQTLRKDERIRLFENTDFRSFLKDDLKGVDFLVSDVSFISLRAVFEKIQELNLQNCEGVFLFKPQFECGKKIADKFSGVIRDKKVHINLLNDFVCFLKDMSVNVCGMDFSPIKGKKGNIEYLIHINGERKFFNIKDLVESAFSGL